MGKNPAFLFYPSDWQRDMMEHPLEIEGFWMRVCCHLWWSSTPGSMSKSAQSWGRLLGIDARKFRRLCEYLLNQNIADISKDNDTFTITSRRMVRDEKLREIRRIAGSKGGNPALKKENILDNQNKEELDNPKKEVRLSPSVSVSVSVSDSIPNNISKDILGAYIEHRKKLKKPLTDHGIKLVINKLIKMENPNDVLNQSIENGWVGIFALKNNGGNNNGRTNYQGSKRQTFEKQGKAQSDGNEYPIDAEF